MVSLPLTLAGRLVGTFNLYAAEPGFFDADELRLLDELATDVGFALEVSERELERHRAESALRASEERFRELADDRGRVLGDRAGHRPPALREPGLRADPGPLRQALYDSPTEWFMAVHPEDRDIAAGEGGPTIDGIGADCEYRIIRPDGEVRWIRDRAFKVRSESGEVVREVGVARDITERRRLEEQLRQSQKMEAIGQLAGGVAHDFNNILTVILGYGDCSCSGARAGSGPRWTTSARSPRRRSAAAALTRQLLAFSRQQVLSPTVLDLNAPCAAWADAAAADRRGHRAVTSVASASLGPVLADPGQLEQVLMNLAVNARDAMPRRHAHHRDRDVELDDAVRAAALGPQPGRVRAAVASATPGTGMDAEIQARIFEPFFTTKEQGKGTGLGLATVYGIVTAERRRRSSRERAGRGTTFDVYLPRARARPSARPRPPRSAPPAGGTGPSCWSRTRSRCAR